MSNFLMSFGFTTFGLNVIIFGFLTHAWPQVALAGFGLLAAIGGAIVKAIEGKTA